MRLPDLQLAKLGAAYASGAAQPAAVLQMLHSAAAREQHRNLWITLASVDNVLSQLHAVEARQRRGESLPLFAVPFAVKDNIDVAGFPTTAACAAYGYVPEHSAAAVQRLLDAGAVCLGKTNMDQFATGLVGTRSPYGACASVFDARYCSGGSSSGSALAVALGLVSFALGTDTAGSGRVPAAFNNIVGLKPSRGLISTRGVVPACRSLDSVSVFAGSSADALAVLRCAEGVDAKDPYSRVASAGRSWDAEGKFRFGVPRAEHLEFFGDAESALCFERAVAAAEALGGTKVEIDFSPFVETARLLYGGPWVAERYAAVGEFIEQQRLRDETVLDPTVQQIILEGKAVSGAEAFRGLYRLEALRAEVAPRWAEMDVLLLPTTPTAYTLEQIAQEPLKFNANLGRYTNFVNLLDLCGVAVPTGFKASGLPFGVTLLAPAFEEASVARLAARFHDCAPARVGNTEAEVLPWNQQDIATGSEAIGSVRLAVAGAHLRGQPLHHELTELGSKFLGSARTAAGYKLFALKTTPPKPGMVRSIERGSSAIALELYELTHEAFGRFVAKIPHPLGIGSVELEDGSWVKGFLCEGLATHDAEDISQHGGWLAFLLSRG
jgi:allophanate hydrolase